MNSNKDLGTHLIIDFHDCKFELLNNKDFIESSLIEAAKLAGANILNVFSHKFSPQGVSTVLTLSESHISIHTFPELGKAASDLYTCGDCDSYKALDYLLKQFNPGNYVVNKITRGITS